jgi:hypothetical protein
LWDLDEKICGEKFMEADWDRKALATLLSKKEQAMKMEGRMADAPMGLRNRCSIWRIIEGALEV